LGNAENLYAAMVSAFLKAWIWEGANRFWEHFWGKRQKEGCENAEIGVQRAMRKTGTQ